MKNLRLFLLLRLLAKMMLATALVGTVFLAGCKEEETPELSSERLITNFTFDSFNPAVVGQIDHDAGIIRLTIPFGTPNRTLTPTITVSEQATVSPASGTPQDFSRFVVYTVTAPSGAQKLYTALVQTGPSNVARIDRFSFPTLFRRGTINETTREVIFQVPFGTNLAGLAPEIVLGEPGSTVSPASGTPQNFTGPVVYTVTAPDGRTIAPYTVRVSVLPQETGVRGVWITNVDSDVLTSRQKIQEAVDRVAALNFNTIFMVVYNKAATMYPSQVMQNLINRPIDPIYAGRDPLREMIDAAHAKNIKVMAWFEYGFAAFNGSPGPILAARPEWASIGTNGAVVVKNGFWWLNALHPDVQQFMTDLVLEVVRNYPDIDGIQGDDRLPAMPTEGGYDAYTREQYRAEHNGAEPPNDTRDGRWVQWRADRLSLYGKRLYEQVKAINPRCLVAMSPSPMNFGLREYLQDYPAWVKGGYVDIVSPQLYRRDDQGIGVYRSLLLDQIAQVGRENIRKFSPGILTFLGSYTPNPEYLVSVIAENRREGVSGEVHFFYNALIAQPETFRAIYPAPAIFPTSF